MADYAAVISAVGGVLGGGGLVAWRNSRIDAAKLAIEIARDADKKADEATAIVGELLRLAMGHFPWDAKAMHEIHRLGGEIEMPPPLFPDNHTRRAATESGT